MATIRSSVPYLGSRNLLPDPRLEGTTMTLGGGTMNDSVVSTGGPDDGAYFRRVVVVPNSNSPTTMDLSAAGSAGIPVTGGESYTISWYARKNPGGGPATRSIVGWYDSTGTSISTTSSNNVSVGSSWARFSDTYVAPLNAAFMQPRIVWSGLGLVDQEQDLAMAQAEVAPLTPFTDGRTITPVLILNYGFTRGSRDVILEPLGSGYPTVFLREAQSRSGTLTMLFSSAAAANEADLLLSRAGRFHFQETGGDAEQDFHFIKSGNIVVTNEPGTRHWTVAVEFREVAAL